jgi:flavin-dependent dehydrogenase
MVLLTKRKMLPDPRRHPLRPFVGHAYKLMRATPRRLVSDGFLLVGDAAGVAYNISGEGIGPAIFSGGIAAETIIEARGDYSEGTLSRYVGRLHDRLGSPYRRWFLSLISLVPASAGPLLMRYVTGSALLRRELVARRWFFRD